MKSDARWGKIAILVKVFVRNPNLVVNAATMSFPRLDRHIHDVIVEKYFALTSGKSISIDITPFVPERAPPQYLNNALRKLTKMYPGLAWAPMAKQGNLRSFILLMAADIEMFKWGWRSESSISSRKLWLQSDDAGVTLDISPLRGNVVRLSAILESPRHGWQLPLPPRGDVKLSMILDRFLAATDYDSGAMQWECGPTSHRPGGFRVVDMGMRGMCQVLW